MPLCSQSNSTPPPPRTQEFFQLIVLFFPDAGDPDVDGRELFQTQRHALHAGDVVYTLRKEDGVPFRVLEDVIKDVSDRPAQIAAGDLTRHLGGGGLDQRRDHSVVEVIYVQIVVVKGDAVGLRPFAHLSNGDLAQLGRNLYGDLYCRARTGHGGADRRARICLLGHLRCHPCRVRLLCLAQAEREGGSAPSIAALFSRNTKG